MLKVRSMIMSALIWAAVVAMCAIVGAVAIWATLFAAAATVAFAVCDAVVAQTEIENRED